MDTEGTLAQLGGRLRALDPPADLRPPFEVEHAFEVLGDSAADFNTFECALSLERWPKTLR